MALESRHTAKLRSDDRICYGQMRTQTTRNDAQIEHQRVVIGNGLNCLNCTPSIASSLSFSSLRAARAPGVRSEFRSPAVSAARHRQSLNGKWFDIHFTIASGTCCRRTPTTTRWWRELMVSRSNNRHPLSAYRADLYRANRCGPGFRSVTEMQQGQVGDQRVTNAAMVVDLPAPLPPESVVPARQGQKFGQKSRSS